MLSQLAARGICSIISNVVCVLYLPLTHPKGPGSSVVEAEDLLRKAFGPGWDPGPPVLRVLESSSLASQSSRTLHTATKHEDKKIAAGACNILSWKLLQMLRNLFGISLSSKKDFKLVTGDPGSPLIS